ncbi:MAG TPA: hypothetical protein VIT92_07490 [Burkholderiaceae bacterium]
MLPLAGAGPSRAPLNPSPLAALQQFESASRARGAREAAPVSLSRAGLDLAAGTAERANDLSRFASGTAHDAVAGFARSLLGDAAEGMRISFEASGVFAQSAYAGLTASYADGAAQAYGISERADFTGSGTITTADGQRFTFEVEVHYAAEASGATAAVRPTGASGQPLALQFGGSAIDLLHLLAHDSLSSLFAADDKDAQAEAKAMAEAETKAQAKDEAKAQARADAQRGTFKLRLLDLLEAPRDSSAELAKAYGLA